MRINQKQKVSKRSNFTTAGERKKPKYVSPDSVVGRLDSDYIGSYLAPKLTDVAWDQLEQYAADLMEHDDKLKNSQSEAKTTNLSLLLEPAPPLFHSEFQIKEFERLLTDTSTHFVNDWKVHVNAAKFERQLNEKYGVFLPVIRHYPQVEHMLKTVQRQYNRGHYSPLRQGPPPIPKTTSIIILFMMYRGGISWDKVGMAALFFLVGLQPWALVAMVVLMHLLVNRRKRTPIRPMPSKIPLVAPYYENFTSIEKKYDLIRQPVGTPISDIKNNGNDSTEINMHDYDCMVIGSGPESLYTAALLSRSGRRVLVLSKERDASRCSNFINLDNAQARKYKDLPFDIDSSNISKLSKQLKIISPALCTSNDTQGGIRFAQVGTEADGHAYEIIAVPGVGTERHDETIPFVLSADAGLPGLMELAATSLGDAWADSDDQVGHSTTGQFVQTCESINNSASNYYLSKVLPDNVNNLRSKSAYEETAIRYASTFLDRAFPLNPHTRCFMAGVGMRGENIKPSACSMGAHVTNICASLDGEGMHYPIGGPRALCRALANVIEKNGGRVVTDVLIESLLFGKENTNDTTGVSPAEEKKSEGEKTETDKDESGVSPPACIGVKLDDGRELKFDEDSLNESHRCTPTVVSMEGFIWTYLIAMPDDIRTKYKVPPGLPALSSRRPQFKILFALKGNAGDLSLTGADYYRLPAASIAFDEVDQSTGDIKQGEIGWKDEEEEVKPATTAEDANGEGTDETDVTTITDVKKKKAKNTKFHSGYSWMHISFPSAKDPSFEDVHGNVTTCVITIEADDDFVTFFDSKPKLYALKGSHSIQSELERLLGKVQKELFEIYPQLEDKVEYGEIQGPYQKGLSHNPEKYAARGIRPQSPYPNLFCGGPDLTVGDSFSAAMVSGWLAANAVVGFAHIDYLFLERHITADIIHYLADSPGVASDDEVAVPFTQKVQVDSDDQYQNSSKED